ncbi:MAG: hypothetical protein AAB706_01435 [Patescibacteria group bacterium]
MTTIIRVAGFIVLLILLKHFFPAVFDGVEQAVLQPLDSDFLQASPISGMKFLK